MSQSRRKIRSVLEKLAHRQMEEPEDVQLFIDYQEISTNILECRFSNDTVTRKYTAVMKLEVDSAFGAQRSHCNAVSAILRAC